MSSSRKIHFRVKKENMGPNYNKLDMNALDVFGREIQNINKYGTIYLLLKCSTFHKKVAL